MEIPKIHEGEYRFCLILWDHEPVTAAQLAKLCLEQLGWKRTTTYTVIKRLGERGILKNENGLITALVSKDEAQAYEIDELVEKKFEGSLPTFATVYKGNIIKNLIMDCQSYTKYRPNETTGGIFVSWRRKEELPTGA